MSDDADYLEYIAESIELIELYLADGRGGLNEELWYHDQRTQDAVLRRMETLADATVRLSPAIRSRHPNISWRKVSGFRNVLAHAYTDVRPDRVWETIVNDLPPLKIVVSEELGRTNIEEVGQEDDVH